MKKKTLMFAAFLLLFSLLNVQVNALTIGVVNEWHANSEDISRIKLPNNRPPNITVRIVEQSHTQSEAKTYGDYAFFQWYNRGFNTVNYYDVYATPNFTGPSDIMVFFCTLSYLSYVCPDMPNTAGVTRLNYLEYEGEWIYPNNGNLIFKNGFKTQGSVILIGRLSSPYPPQADKYTACHELGHAYGWMGHSNNSSNNMYHTFNMNQLTAADAVHVRQIKTY